MLTLTEHLPDSAREAQTSALIGALSAAAVLLLLLMFVCYKLKQVCYLTSLKFTQIIAQRISDVLCNLRNQNTKYAGRSSRAPMATTTPSLTPTSCRTTSSGSFLGTNSALVRLSSKPKVTSTSLKSQPGLPCSVSGAVVGSGAFGKVVEATAYGLGTNDVTRVAVKMLKCELSRSSLTLPGPEPTRLCLVSNSQRSLGGERRTDVRTEDTQLPGLP